MPQIDNPQRSLLAPLAPGANRILGLMGVLVGVVALGVAGWQFRQANYERAIETRVLSAEGISDTVTEPWGNSTRERERYLAQLSLADTEDDLTIDGFPSLEAARDFAAEREGQTVTVYVNEQTDPPTYSLTPTAGPLAYATAAGGALVGLYGLLLLVTNRTIQQHAGVE